MGGFFICPRNPDQHVEELEIGYANSIDVFSRKGLSLDRRLDRDNFVAYRFNKVHERHEHVLELDNGDFVLAVGTVFYDGKIGVEALRGLYDDHCAGRTLDEKVKGNYFVAIWANNELTAFNDFSGYYPVYCNQETSILSNSLMAVAKSGASHMPSRQEFTEFILNGFFAGNETLLPAVQSLDRKYIWQICPDVKKIRRQPHYKPISAGADISAIADDATEALSNYFKMLHACFPGSIGSALSGGYDSRLMVALLRKAGNDPYLYVYGGQNASDVTVAKMIADAENIPLEHIDKSVYPTASPEAFAEHMDRDIYFFDGIKALGGLDDGTDLETRYHRAKKAVLQLNGAGGEIYREIWNLHDRKIDLIRFLKLRYDRGSYDFCRPGFDVDTYYDYFAEKVRKTLDIDRTWITRSEVEMLFPFLRNVFAAPNSAANAQISDALIPFMEPEFIFPSFDVPIRYKYYGRLQAEIIKRVDPVMAGYGSSYGINFSDPIPASYRFMRALERHIPLPARLLKRRILPSRYGENAYFMSDDYIRRICNPDDLRISEFVDVKKIGDPETLSRAFSIELLLSRL